MPDQMHFTRRTLLAASEFIERAGTSAKFDLMVQRLELSQCVPHGDKQSVAKKRYIFNEALIERASQLISTREGQMTIGEALVAHESTFSGTEVPQDVVAEPIRLCELVGSPEDRQIADAFSDHHPRDQDELADV